MTNVRPLQLAVLQILDAALGQLDHSQAIYGNWSVQGFGVLRLYVRDLGRLHLWDRALRYPNVSLIHNHSWDLRSTVVSGYLHNVRYTESDWKALSWAEPYQRQRLLTGYDARMVQPEPDAIWLSKIGGEEWLTPGATYQQRRDEIHLSDPTDGTITMMERQEDSDGQANVYWPTGTKWGDAKPRLATTEEIRVTIEMTLPKLEAELRRARSLH